MRINVVGLVRTVYRPRVIHKHPRHLLTNLHIFLRVHLLAYIEREKTPVKWRPNLGPVEKMDDRTGDVLVQGFRCRGEWTLRLFLISTLVGVQGQRNRRQESFRSRVDLRFIYIASDPVGER